MSTGEPARTHVPDTRKIRTYRVVYRHPKAPTGPQSLEKTESVAILGGYSVDQAVHDWIRQPGHEHFTPLEVWELVRDMRTV